MSKLAMYLFGSPEVWLDNRSISFPSRKALALSAYLAVTGGNHTRDSLAALFWPESSTSHAKASLRQTLWTLASIGLGDWFNTDREDISILPGYFLDTLKFQELIDKGQRHEHHPDHVCYECLPSLKEAVELYRDDFLQGFTLRDSPQFDDWQYFQTERLRQMFSNALEQLVVYSINQLDWNNAILFGQRFVAINPLNESAQRMLIEAYAFSGKRSFAIRQYNSLEKVLKKELRIEPDGQTKILYERILDDQSSTISIPPDWLNHSSRSKAQQNNLPFPLTNFIGREQEAAEIIELIYYRRLISLTGPGGIGKTRLALEIGHRLSNKFLGGVWWVDLSNISGPDYVAHALAAALGMQEQADQTIMEALIQTLKFRPPVLFVLDCCEHVVSAVARLTISLLSSCPYLKIIVTSREVLNVTGETIYNLRGLKMPNGHESSIHFDEPEAESIQLFVDRASLIQPNFRINQENFRAVADICQRLEGMPLGIELAAARLREMDAQNIADRLDEHLIQLNVQYRDVAPRHQTLKAAFDWSYNLLSQPEQTLFTQLSIFNGNFSSRAVETIFRNTQSKQIISSLVDKSMVLAEKDKLNQVHYRLLDTLREYGFERLSAQKKAEGYQKRHAIYYLALTKRSAEKLTGQDQESWLTCLKIEHDNIRAALQWLLDRGESELALKLAGWTWRFWWMHGHYREGYSWLEKALSSGVNKPSYARARALNGAGILARGLGDYNGARKNLEESLAIYDQLGDSPGAANALNSLGNLAHAHGDDELAYEYHSRSMDHRKALGDERGIAISLNNLGNIVHEQKDFQQAYELYLESRKKFEATNDSRGIGAVLINLGYLYLDQQDGAAAETLFSESLAIIGGLEQKEDIIECLEGLAGAASLAPEPTRAYRLMEMASGLRTLINAPVPPYNRQRHQTFVDRIMAQISTSEIESIQKRAELFSLNQAIAYALRREQA